MKRKARGKGKRVSAAAKPPAPDLPSGARARIEGACEAIQDLIPRLVRSRLGPEETELVQDHLRRCPGCRSDLEASRLLSGVLLRHLQGPEPPPGFGDLVRSRLRRRRDG